MVSTRTIPFGPPLIVGNSIDTVKNSTSAAIETAKKTINKAAETARKTAEAKAEELKNKAIDAFKTICCPSCAPIKTHWSASGPEKGAAPNDRSWSGIDPTTRPVPALFGFDNRTNIPATADRGKNEYWNKSGGPGAPAGRRALDGAAWVSVTTGKSATIEVQFKGYGTSFCISNATIEIDNPKIASASPGTFTTNSAKLMITGLAEGECTVKLMCQKKPIGWCHVAVYDAKVASARLIRMNLIDATGVSLTSAAPITAAEQAAVKAMLDKNYKQCSVSWNVINGGVKTYSAAASIAEYHISMANSITPDYNVLFPDAIAEVPKMGADIRDVYYFEPLVFNAPVTKYTQSGGVANGIPATECFVYAPITNTWGLNLVGHELGHTVGLHHPNNAPAVVPQLPDNFRLPLLVEGGGPQNVMVSDHNNMMGYGAWDPSGYSLRYEQWKIIRANI